MNRTLAAGLILALLAGITAFAQKLESQYTPKSIAGVWKGKLQQSDAVPAVEVSLKPDGNRVDGKIIFYVIDNDQVKDQHETQLLETKLENQWLYFKVMREDGTPARFRMKFTKDDEALLSSADEPSATGREPVRLIRSQQ